MKIFANFYLLFILGVFTTNAQLNSIKGKITSNGKPLPYVNVYLKNTKIGTSSNENGFFELQNIENGVYTIVASSIGFKSKSAKINVKNASTITKIST